MASTPTSDLSRALPTFKLAARRGCPEPGGSRGLAGVVTDTNGELGGTNWFAWQCAIEADVRANEDETLFGAVGPGFWHEIQEK
jgi:hypothetical protein